MLRRGFRREDGKRFMVWCPKGAAVGSLFGVGYGILETEGAFSDVNQREDTKYLVEWNFKRNLIIVDTASVISLAEGSPENKFSFGVLRIPF